jgi:L-threonylcarbamoyladenylate synthase
MADRETPHRRTRVVTLDPERPDPSGIRAAARCLARGGLVVFPTETVYGLGADATNGQAVARVFAAKGRPPDNPLIVHVASPSEVPSLAREVDSRARALMEAFWPGPLSLVFLRTSRIASEVSCGLDTVAVRMPRHAVALELLRQAGMPVAAPSANISGRPSPTRAEDALADLAGLVDYILDAGPCPLGVESTVLDLTGAIPVVLRPGGVTIEQLREVAGEVRLLGQAGEAVEPPATRSPGLRHRHYSPRARLILVLPDPAEPGGSIGAPAAADNVGAAVARSVAAEAAAGRRVGVACSDETAEVLKRAEVFSGGSRSADAETAGTAPPTVGPVIAWGSRDRPEEIAARLFAVLRDLDQAGVDAIVAEGIRPEGLGLAVNDRLRRAAAVVKHIAPGPPPAIVTAAAIAAPELILLVCSGNTCRSPLGMVILRRALAYRGLDAAYAVASAGTVAVDGLGASFEACQAASERGLDLSGHRSRFVTGDLLARAKLVLTMTRRHRRTLLDLHPGAVDRVFTLKGYAAGAGTSGAIGSLPSAGSVEDIPDPIGLGIEAYRRVVAEIERGAAAVVERLRNSPGFEGQAGNDRNDLEDGPDESSRRR